MEPKGGRHRGEDWRQISKLLSGDLGVETRGLNKLYDCRGRRGGKRLQNSKAMECVAKSWFIWSWGLAG